MAGDERRGTGSTFGTSGVTHGTAPPPRPIRRTGETTASFNARMQYWALHTNGGRSQPTRYDEPAPVFESSGSRQTGGPEGNGTTPGGPSVASTGGGGPGGLDNIPPMAPQPAGGGRPTGDGRSTGPDGITRGLPTAQRPTTPYGMTPVSYNSGDPFGSGITYDERGNPVGNVVWGVGPTNEPGYGDATAPTTARIEYDSRQALEWLLKLSTTSPSEYADMVYQLWQAGYLPGAKEDLITGAFSTEVANAFNSLYIDVDRLNASGDQQSIFDYLGSRIQGRIESGALGADGNAAPPPRSYTDPETLMASVRAASESVLGRRLTDSEASAFASHFRGLEDSAYNASEGKQNFTAPDVGGQAESYVYSDKFAAEESQMAGGRYVETLRSMMGLG